MVLILHLQMRIVPEKKWYPFWHTAQMQMLDVNEASGPIHSDRQC